MAADVRMPLLGDVMQEGTLVEWLQADGAVVAKGDPIYQLETDKVSLEVEAPAAGVLQQVVAAGAVVPVNGLLAQIVEAGTAYGSAAPTGPSGTGGEGTPAAAVLSTTTAAARTGAAASVVPGGRGDSSVPNAGEIRASPAARRLARELGVDLAAVAAARPGARLREADVEAYASSQAAAAPTVLRASAPAPQAPVETGVTAGPPGRQARLLAGRRRVIAERMRQSLQQMAQLTISQQVDVTECTRLRAQLGQVWGDDARPSYTNFVVRAAALALREHPELNATLEDDALVLHEAIDVGLAVDTAEGLMVPVLRGVDRLSLRDLTRRTADAAERARANRLGPDDLHGGTFTVTTLGALGIDFFTPIVNPPQVAIIGIGRVFPILALDAGQIVERWALYLNLSFDHRALDGAPAARFLNRVKALLAVPVGLL